MIAIPGVVGTAVGLTADGRPAIKIFTKNTGVAGLPDKLEGIPAEVHVTGEFFANTCTTSPGYVNTCKNTDAWPVPVPIGVSTGNVGECSAGTIGVRVKAGAAVYALSNNHVYALKNTAPLGSNVLQPGLYDTGCSSSGSTVLGTLSAFAPIAFCASSCPSNTIDAAIAISDVTKLDNATPPTAYWWPSSVVQSATLGLGVKKYGRTTSMTTGQVTGIDATVTVVYRPDSALFIHQILLGSCGSACSGLGDSGSLWVTNDASANPVGLHFGSNLDGSVAIANQIGNVLAYFGVTIDNTTHPTASGGLWPASGCDNAPYPWIASIMASGNTITLADGCGNTGTITLSGGVTASGGLTAYCGNCSAGFPNITSITASGSNIITVSDDGGNSGTITLSGARASGGLIASCGNCSLEPWPNIMAITATGSDGFFVYDDSYDGSHTGYIKLSY
ncbi:MAG: hypothetical protein AUH75_08390 [Gemmatimonadetes bacterium 13_1_40CM_4_65_7]|nr:MAG: hypothetical protein AUH75_08390 [Gemmatimonadetes bacterium 13_1_40CM_4_65_7]